MTAGPALAVALAAFQAAMPTVLKGNTATVPTKSGGQYRYTYADLGDVVRAAMPLLTTNGLSFSVCPRRCEDGKYELAGILLHESGEYLEGALPLPHHGTAQELGSAITYARRYLLGAMTGIVTDDDDDGRLGSQAQHTPPTRNAPSHEGPKSEPPPEPQVFEDDGTMMLDRTRARLFAMFGERGINDREQQLAGINRIIPRHLDSRSELTEAEAQLVITVLARTKGQG